MASKDEKNVEERNKSPQPKIEIDLETENWAKSLSEKGLELDSLKSQDLKAKNCAKSSLEEGLKLDTPESQDYIPNY